MKSGARRQSSSGQCSFRRPQGAPPRMYTYSVAFVPLLKHHQGEQQLAVLPAALEMLVEPCGHVVAIEQAMTPQPVRAENVPCVVLKFAPQPSRHGRFETLLAMLDDRIW